MGLFSEKCPECGSKNTVRSGRPYGKQRYRCNNCWHTFYAVRDYAPVTKRRSMRFRL